MRWWRITWLANKDTRPVNSDGKHGPLRLTEAGRLKTLNQPAHLLLSLGSIGSTLASTCAHSTTRLIGRVPVIFWKAVQPDMQPVNAKTTGTDP